MWVSYVQSSSQNVMTLLILLILAEIRRCLCLADIFGGLAWLKMLPNMWLNVTSCQRNKASIQRPAGLLQPLPVPSESWSSVSMDFVVDLPATADGYDSIMVTVDRLTKMVHLAPCRKTDDAVAVSWLFYKHVASLHGFPESFVTDRDPKFMSKFWQSLMQRLHMSHFASHGFPPSD
jgi:hypothetical protein